MAAPFLYILDILTGVERTKLDILSLA